MSASTDPGSVFLTDESRQSERRCVSPSLTVFSGGVTLHSSHRCSSSTPPLAHPSGTRERLTTQVLSRPHHTKSRRHPSRECATRLPMDTESSASATLAHAGVTWRRRSAARPKIPMPLNVEEGVERLLQSSPRRMPPTATRIDVDSSSTSALRAACRPDRRRARARNSTNTIWRLTTPGRARRER
jgi:hypothetical protein